MTETRVLIQAALNGSRAPGSHPALPVTPAALAEDAAACVAAGAREVHLHVRGPDRLECLAAGDVARTVAAIRARVPALPVGVSTGAWIVGDPGERHRMVELWDVLPDFASVNFHEAGAADLARLLIGRGIGVEAGLNGVGGAEALAESGLGNRCRRMLIEPGEHDPAAALENVARVEAVLDRAGITAPRMVHGAESAAWPVLRAAVRRGLETRIGLEDVLEMPDGTPAPGNAALVAEAARLAGAGGG